LRKPQAIEKSWWPSSGIVYYRGAYITSKKHEGVGAQFAPFKLCENILADKLTSAWIAMKRYWKKRYLGFPNRYRHWRVDSRIPLLGYRVCPI
jgi:hypothetical protein